MFNEQWMNKTMLKEFIADISYLFLSRHSEVVQLLLSKENYDNVLTHTCRSIMALDQLQVMLVIIRIVVIDYSRLSGSVPGPSAHVGGYLVYTLVKCPWAKHWIFVRVRVALLLQIFTFDLLTKGMWADTASHNMFSYLIAFKSFVYFSQIQNVLSCTCLGNFNSGKSNWYYSVKKWILSIWILYCDYHYSI